MKLPKNHKDLALNSGQTLIEILIAFAVFAVLTNAIFTIVFSSYSLVSLNRSRITARHLAQEKMELIRNLPYDGVGTIGGIPDGPLLQEETIKRNGLNYTVKTDVIYVDDTFDNTAPTDLLPTDYKRVRIEILWDGIAASKKNPVVFVTDVVPKGIEQAEGGGTLSILVFNANGKVVPQANVTIKATSVDPPINLSLQTSDNGRIVLPGAPACISCYEITVTKEGYSLDRTYSNLEIANPNKPHQSILEGGLTDIGFAIDRVSTINLTSLGTRSSGFSPLANVSFHLQSTRKILGTDISGANVYLIDDVYTTNESGNITIEDFVWDTYSFTPEGFSYDIAGANPMLPLAIDPGNTYDYSVSFAPNSEHSLLLGFKNPSETPIASVSATLSDGLGYDKTIQSGAPETADSGQVFFPDLNEATYTLTATCSGFLDLTDTINVTGNTQQYIYLTPK